MKISFRGTRLIHPIGCSIIGAAVRVLKLLNCKQLLAHPHNEKPDGILWKGVWGVGEKFNSRTRPTKASLESANQVYELESCIGKRQVFEHLLTLPQGSVNSDN